MFWYHQGPRAHQLPDARSDVKGRTLLRRIRSGYTAISPSRTPEAQSPRPESIAETEDDATSTVPDDQQQQELTAPATPPDYEAAERPPAYAQQPRPRPQPQPLALPPALPGYTPLPGTLEDPARDLILIQPLAARRRYRDSLRRRLTSTKKLLGGGDGSDTGSDTESLRDSDSARGVVMYRENDRWVGSSAAPVTTQGKGEQKVETRRGFRGWVRRAWSGLMEFLDEHPYLFVLAVFVIVVVVICLLI